jgi:hypothetical protein
MSRRYASTWASNSHLDMYIQSKARGHIQFTVYNKRDDMIVLQTTVISHTSHLLWLTVLSTTFSSRSYTALQADVTIGLHLQTTPRGY